MINLEELREQIQDDLITIMDSQFGEVEYVAQAYDAGREEITNMLCQAVVNRINPLIEKRETQFAEVTWSIEDLKTLQEDWTEEQLLEWMDLNEDHVRDRLIELGWEVIDTMISFPR
jgi:hypothetical protein